MAETPEATVKRQIKAYLKSLPNCYQFWPVQTGWGASTLDCLACINGKFFAIEVKRKGVMSATPRQNQVIKAVSDAKGVAFVTDDLDRLIIRVAEFGG